MSINYVKLIIKNKLVLISKVDEGEVLQYSWLLDASKNYAGRWFYSPKRWVSLARFIDNTPKELELDHINRNSLDNRRENLRRCTRKQNMQNRGPHRGKYKGVSFEARRNKWRATIRLDGHCKHLGYFDCPKKAALKYNEVAKYNWGEFAWLNKI